MLKTCVKGNLFLESRHQIYVKTKMYEINLEMLLKQRKICVLSFLLSCVENDCTVTNIISPKRENKSMWYREKNVEKE